MRVLVVNAGSSSLKLSVLGPDDELIVEKDIARHESALEDAPLRGALEAAPPVDAVGHRIVHGGSVFRHAVLLDPRREDQLRQVSDLAPLHNAPALAAVAAVAAWRPDVPQVACFDTEFHATMPPEATEYALPATWRGWGLRRFGFHGLSHAYATRRAAQLLGRPVEALRLVTAHLGSGASLAAVAGGRSVDTTMGFTPLEGLVMATRSGTVDPGIVLWAMRHKGLSVDEVEDALERRSGVLGLSETSGDMRAVLAAADQGDERARLALDVYLHRLRAQIAAMVAALGDVDGLVFTGGVGEGSARVRREACTGLGFLHIELDEEPDEPSGGPDRVVSRPGAARAVVVVHAREDLEIARQVRALVPHPD